MMKKEEKTELLLIALITGAVRSLPDTLPRRMGSGYLVLTFGLLFLCQTLLRDLWLLWKLRGVSRDSMPTGTCMCLESGIGFAPVAIAALLISSGLSRPVPFAGWAWTLGTAAVMLSGFALKDYVIEWNPLRVRKDPDHINMRFVWRSKSKRKS
jgi:hypothetical protein